MAGWRSSLHSQAKAYIHAPQKQLVKTGGTRMAKWVWKEVIALQQSGFEENETLR
jgi:hypothetical protein